MYSCTPFFSFIIEYKPNENMYFYIEREFSMDPLLMAVIGLPLTIVILVIIGFINYL